MTDACTALTCQDAEELLPLVAEGLLDPYSDPDLFAHLAECQCCQTSLETHDLITLSLSADTDFQPATPRAEVIHFQMSKPLSIAASFLFVAMLGLIGGLSLQSDQSDGPDPLVMHEPETQILKVIPREDGNGDLIIIRHQDETLVIRQDQIDNGTASQTGNNSKPAAVNY